MNKMELSSLPKIDHHTIMNVIEQLGYCDTIDQFNHLLKTQVIPLTNSHGVFYSKINNGREPPDILDSVCDSSICRYSWKNFLDVISDPELIDDALFDDSLSMLATDSFHHTNSQCHNCHLLESHDCAMRLQYCNVVALCDAPKPAMALFICRLTSNEQAYSTRDLNLLQMLQATLLQTIKAIVFQQENQNLKQLLAYISDRSEPFAVVRFDGHILHRNHAFTKTVGKNTPTLSKQIRELYKSKTRDNHEIYSFISRLGKRLYQISITPHIEIDRVEDQQIYSVQYTRLSDKNKHRARNLTEIGLTTRELEITSLICQGLSSRLIAEQLNLSYHTVRNHIKHIYQKTGVSTRTELINWDKKEIESF